MNSSAYLYSGLGNKILIVDLIHQTAKINSKQVQFLNEKERFDQVLVLEPPRLPDTDYSVVIYNCDGSKAKNCINGARCLAKYIFDRGLALRNFIKIDTDWAFWELAKKEGLYEVSFSLGVDNKKDGSQYYKGRSNIFLEGHEIIVNEVNIGNDHAVMFVPNLDERLLATLGESAQKSTYFLDGINIGMAVIKSKSEINLRVYERAAGMTDACGSGACAAVICATRDNRVDGEVTVNFKKGSLLVNYEIASEKVTVLGEAKFIKEINLNYV